MTWWIVGMVIIVSITVASAAAPSTATSPAPTTQPPVAKRIPHETQLHGDTLSDPYFWLREKDNPEVLAYLKAENAYTDAMLKDTESLRERLYNEMVARIKEDDQDPAYPEGPFDYFSRTVKGKQYRIYERVPRDQRAQGARVILDENELATGKPYFSGMFAGPSDDGQYLLYGENFTGWFEFTLHVKDMQTGQVLPDALEHTGGGRFASDNKTILYTVQDTTTNRPYRVCRHVLGTDPKSDELVYEEKDDNFNVGVGRSRDRAFFFIVSESTNTTEVRSLRSDLPSDVPTVMIPRKDGLRYYPDHAHGQVYLRINDTGPNFRIVRFADDGGASAPEKWEEMVAHRPDTMIEDLDLFTGHLVCWLYRDALPRVRIEDLKTRAVHEVEFPSPAYSVSPEHNAEFDTSTLRFTYESLATPESVFAYDMNTRVKTVLKRRDPQGGYDPAAYQEERIFATAKDGTRVPISIVYKKDSKRTGSERGPRPMLLDAYGAYGIPENPEFDVTRISLLDRGVAYAIAHVRGGGEYGRPWHDAGRMMNKMNTFTDFIACAEHLAKEAYTSKDKLIIEGGSAGGLTMGAVTNMRPDLFHAVVMHVPFVDIINTMSDESLPLTTQEYTEWGNPHVKAEYEYIRQYSPYDNVRAQDYPAMLVRTSLNDSQVPYWEPTKLVAKLRASKTDRHPLLLHANLDPAGHGGLSGRYNRLKDRAFDEAFMLSQWGLE